MRVHQEDIALFKDATTLPIGQQATARVAFERRPDLKAINTDAETLPATGLAGTRQHTFDEGYATRKVAAIGKEGCKRLRGHHDHEIIDHGPSSRLQPIEPDRHA